MIKISQYEKINKVAVALGKKLIAVYPSKFYSQSFTLLWSFFQIETDLLFFWSNDLCSTMVFTRLKIAWYWIYHTKSLLKKFKTSIIFRSNIKLTFCVGIPMSDWQSLTESDFSSSCTYKCVKKYVRYIEYFYYNASQNLFIKINQFKLGCKTFCVAERITDEPPLFGTPSLLEIPSLLETKFSFCWKSWSK